MYRGQRSVHCVIRNQKLDECLSRVFLSLAQNFGLWGSFRILNVFFLPLCQEKEEEGEEEKDVEEEEEEEEASGSRNGLNRP